MSSYYLRVLHHWLPSLFASVKFLVFPSEVNESPPPGGGTKNCSFPTQLPFLPKNPMNQTGNTTAGKIDIGSGDHKCLCAIMASLTSHVPQLWQLWQWVYMEGVFLEYPFSYLKQCFENIIVETFKLTASVRIRLFTPRLSRCVQWRQTYCWGDVGSWGQVGVAGQPALERETRLWGCHRLPSLGHHSCSLLCWVRCRHDYYFHLCCHIVHREEQSRVSGPPLWTWSHIILLCRNNMFDVADWLVVADTVSPADPSLGKRYRVLQVFYHPRYNRNNNDYDVGLLRTVTDVDMTGQRRRTFHLFELSEPMFCFHSITWEIYLML